MKKNVFFPTFVALVLANIFVYSCQKEDLTEAATQQAPSSGLVSSDRDATCPEIQIFDGVNLIICGIDAGTDECMLCNNSSHMATVTSNGETFPFTNSSTFYICNPTPNLIKFSVGFKCVDLNPQTFSIPGFTWQTYHVDHVSATCCIAHQGCTHQ